MDWLTVTCRDPEKRDEFEALAVTELQVEQREGNKMKPWRMTSFEGFACGGVGYATSPEMAMLRLSSKAAFVCWRRAYELATNCSRIDLQLTVSGVPNATELIHEHRAEALAHIASWSNPPEVAIRDSNRRTPTLYLGARTSAWFGRAYDKAFESKMDHYKGCLRYEAQFNDKAASRVASALLSSPSTVDAIAGKVVAQFASRGCYPRANVEPGNLLELPRRRSDHSKRLRWLRTQVRPAVEALRADGHLVEILSALGLQEFSAIANTGPHGPNTDEEKG